jgi:hypothetical protein
VDLGGGMLPGLIAREPAAKKSLPTQRKLMLSFLNAWDRAEGARSQVHLQ